MANKVFLNKQNIIEVILEDDQTAASMQRVVDEVVAMVEMRRAAGKSACILASLLDMGVLVPEARKFVVEAAQTHSFDKFALVGSGSILRLGVNLIAQAIGKRTHIGYFEDYDEAIAWLKK